ncbi:aspartyl/glutamyl-tRNA(Asn/Gln) amidotransferase subunit A [Caenibius tardaugens NBRC 16725]|uniref:Aspartyl/glutamyl-tRNA(Asn/Gln) amidotransferase subunit A n=1 Tax=Caenibius tardaugens NBRC 16725 TaxID=1219035 RepID=U2YQ06_9SPHN|nr:AtzE family amidohydrolase [Caenibius tardaugens]AZI35348.1 AtzE family amidohydrolase [Caenibius tardaugens NBRC 16725]GAD51030.1 aspartyl/glutamyl-tRNA(Asn/Gln) amidotransferase subunit A [Caenibius tardaugens NBRC 16725]
MSEYTLSGGASAFAVAAAVRSGQVKAVAVAQAALQRITLRNPAVNAITRVLEERALAEAATVDAAVTEGRDPGPLAGVPYAVKDLFDIAGLSTTAGAARLEHAPPATRDAEAIDRMRQAGAVLVGTCNMDEFAYGFVTDNARWGQTRNPHDLSRFAGGSSGGSAAAVAAGMVPLALGSDTNGSIRIPASLCGLYGTKPSHASLPRDGVYPFVHTLDDIGAFARTAGDLALVEAVLRGDAQPVPAASHRAAFLDGWFARNLSPGMEAAIGRLREGLGNAPIVALEGVDRARSAAYLITAYEGGQLHRDGLRIDPLSFDPATRDRLIAGAALPEAVYQEALAYRAVFAAQFADIFRQYDVLIAPAVYGPAPLIDDPMIPIDGAMQPARANLGLYTQPISFLGLPVVAAPLAVPGLPMGVQLIGAPGCDHTVLEFAAQLEAQGLIASTPLPEAA